MPSSLPDICQHCGKQWSSEDEHPYRHQFVHSDETGFSQDNGDGLNPRQTKGWLWVLVTPLVMVFSVVLSRSQATVKALLGEDFKLTSCTST